MIIRGGVFAHVRTPRAFFFFCFFCFLLFAFIFLPSGGGEEEKHIKHQTESN